RVHPLRFDDGFLHGGGGSGVLSRRHRIQCWPAISSGWPQGKHLRQSNARTGSRYVGGLSDSALWCRGDWRSSLSSSRRSNEYWRSKVHHSLAERRWSVEDHSGAQLRSPSLHKISRIVEGLQGSCSLNVGKQRTADIEKSGRPHIPARSCSRTSPCAKHRIDLALEET